MQSLISSLLSLLKVKDTTQLEEVIKPVENEELFDHLFISKNVK